MKAKISALVLLAGMLATAASLEQAGGIYRLSTAELIVEVSAAVGGKVTRVLDRQSGMELTQAYPYQQAPAGSGLFADRLWPLKGRTARHYEREPYSVLSTSADREQAEIVLRCESNPLAIEKTISIREGERKITARYALSNPTDQEFCGRFWSSNVLTPPGDDWQIRLPTGKCGESIKQLGPEQETLLTHNCKTPQGGNYFSGDPKQDFGAVYSAAGGAALLAPFELLDCFYCHIPAAGGTQLPTLEWMSTPLLLRPLAVGKADAVNHPELSDPLQDYIVRFETSVVPFTAFDFETFRPLPETAKLTRFMPILENASPHFDFAAPAVPLFARQQEKPLVITVCDSVISSEFFDFTRRFNCEAEAVEGWRMHAKGDTSYGGWNIPDPEAMLAKQLARKPQVVILPGTFETALSQELSATLQQLVSSGETALIYVSDRARFPSLLPGKGQPVPADLLRGIPLQVEAREFTVGKGKAFWVPFRLHRNNRVWARQNLLLPVPESTAPLNQEYYYAFYGRLLRYALGYDSPARIAEAELKGDTLQVSIDSTIAAPAEISGQKISLTAGRNRVTVPVDRSGPNGSRDVFLMLAVDGYTSDVFIAQVPVRHAAALEALRSEKYAHEPDEAIRGTVTVAGPGELRLKVSLSDATGRVLALQETTVTASEQSFRLEPSLPGVNSYLLLAAELYQAGVLLDRQTQVLSRRTADNSRLRFVLWHNSNTSPTADLRHQSMSEIGFTHILGGQSHSLSAFDARYGAEMILKYGGRYMVNTLHRFFQNNIAKEKLVRNPCLRDPEGLADIRAQVSEAVAKHSGNYPVFYYSADENSLGWHDTPHDYCRSPHCLQAFRTWLQKKYPSLERLNALWKTSFSRWEEVVPPRLDEAKQQENFAPWLEHRRFMLGALDAGVETVLQTVRDLDPQGKLAHSGQGLTRINDCWDWRVMLRHYSLSGLYGRNSGLPDLVRTLQPGYPAGLWNGYGMPLEMIRSNCWNDLCNGLFAPAYWYDQYFYRRGDNRLNETGLHQQKLIAEVNASGIEPLCTDGTRTASPFTVLYSPDCLLAAVVTGCSSVIGSEAYTNNFNGWTQMLRSAGYAAPQVIGDDRLSSISPATHPVLILPLLQLLSDSAVSALQEYVQDGGVLVIDAQAGIFDDFGQLREENPLLQMAGISVPLASGAGGGAVEFKQQLLRLTATGATAKASSAATLGAIVSKSPAADFAGIKLSAVDKQTSGAFFLNQHGKGKVVYLNALLDGFELLRGDTVTMQPILAAFRDLFGSLGFNPVNAAIPGVNFAEYRYGVFRTLLFVRGAGAGSVPVHSPLGAEYHLYDTLEHRYLGPAQAVSCELAPHAARMLLASPQQLGDMRCDASFDGRRITLTARQQPGAALRVELCHNNQPVRPLARNLACQNEGRWQFDLGLQPSGTWRISVLNVLSGETYAQEYMFK
ncbi:MAG: hypothetical protein GX564_02045 [Oligosphaeraceae bacterium]|nr:hypothetical protein [Oligosphaeraceae bacterium]